jgi:putative two-component system response regulator
VNEAIDRLIAERQRLDRGLPATVLASLAAHLGVAGLAVALGARLGLSEGNLSALRLGGILHDVGKIGVPEAILNKQGPLEEKEWELMRTHTELGYKICLPLVETIGPALDVIRHHHEKLDGSSYPDHLKGDAISILARIMSVVDVYDALVSDRPYRKAMSREKAFAILHEEVQAGKIDGNVVAALEQIESRKAEAHDGASPQA